MNKFSVAGVSRLPNGVLKIRFGNDMTRVKVMAKNGDTDINLMEIPEPMEKGDVVKYLMTTDLMNDAETADVIQDANDKYNSVKTVKAPSTKKPRVKKEVAVDPVAKLAELKKRAKVATE